jgi:hypothetical protein
VLFIVGLPVLNKALVVPVPDVFVVGLVPVEVFVGLVPVVPPVVLLVVLELANIPPDFLSSVFVPPKFSDPVVPLWVFVVFFSKRAPGLLVGGKRLELDCPVGAVLSD